MNWIPDSELSWARERLIETCGGYLANPIRDADTCEICTAPVNPGYRQCMRCERRLEVGTNYVLPLAYANHTSQSGHLMRGYKDGSDPAARSNLLDLVLLLLAYGLQAHWSCITGPETQRVVGLTVPSRRGRQGIHPLQAITDAMGLTDDRARLVAASAAAEGRVTSKSQFEVAANSSNPLRGAHVLIIDDTWTTGANAQSAALAASEAGAEDITVVVIARWLDPDFGPTSSFLSRRRPFPPYDPDICPVTGGACR